MKIDELLEDPWYWQNNRRRYHGLKPIRNNKKRIKSLAYDQKLFQAIDEFISNEVIKQIDAKFEEFADIKEIKVGDKVEQPIIIPGQPS